MSKTKNIYWKIIQMFVIKLVIIGGDFAEDDSIFGN